MAIIALQRRIREVGRIRLGVQGAKDGKTFPRKLDRFRFTSADRTVIEACATLYGGDASAWRNGDRDEFEVITNAHELAVLIPPGTMAFSQFYEQWAKGFCTHRCDGEWNTVKDTACTCDPDDRECAATTRLSVILPDLPGLGVWRVESHGYYAAVELGAAVELIGQMAGGAGLVPARLRLDKRELRRLDKGKAVVRKIVVPVLDLDVSVNQVQALGAAPAPASIGTGTTPAISTPDTWQPIPPAQIPATAVSLEAQLAEVDTPAPKPARKNSAAPLPKTGRKPRTVAQRQRDDANAADVDDRCPMCDGPYGGEPLIPNRERVTDANGTVPRFVHKACHDAIDQQPPDSAETDLVEPVGREPTNQPPVPAEHQAVNGEGVDGGDRPDRDHAARIARPTKPTAKMHSKIFALLAETLPVDNGTSGADADAARREYEYGLSTFLGEPIGSHKDLSFEGGRNLIDALEGIKSGAYAWDGENERLVDPNTGEVMTLDAQEEPF